jgi:hypothetical protein
MKIVDDNLVPIRFLNPMYINISVTPVTSDEEPMISESTTGGPGVHLQEVPREQKSQYTKSLNDFNEKNTQYRMQRIEYNSDLTKEPEDIPIDNHFKPITQEEIDIAMQQKEIRDGKVK